MKRWKFDPDCRTSVLQFPAASRIVSHRYPDIFRAELPRLVRSHERFDCLIVWKGLEADLFVQLSHARQALIRLGRACLRNERQPHQHRLAPSSRRLRPFEASAIESAMERDAN